MGRGLSKACLFSFFPECFCKTFPSPPEMRQASCNRRNFKVRESLQGLWLELGKGILVSDPVGAGRGKDDRMWGEGPRSLASETF